jgi:hypothetical protein
MVEVETFEAGANYVPVGLWLTVAKFDNQCCATQEFIVAQQCDPSLPIVQQ